MTRPTVEKVYIDDGISLMKISGRLVFGAMGGDAGIVLTVEDLRKLVAAFNAAIRDAETEREG